MIDLSHLFYLIRLVNRSLKLIDVPPKRLIVRSAVRILLSLSYDSIDKVDYMRDWRVPGGPQEGLFCLDHLLVVLINTLSFLFFDKTARIWLN